MSFVLVRAFGGDAKPSALMSGRSPTVAFTVISILGPFVFFHAGDAPVGWLFVGLSLIYISDFFGSLGSGTGVRALGLFHLLTGWWLMYLTVATVLNFVSGYSLPL